MMHVACHSLVNRTNKQKKKCNELRVGAKQKEKKKADECHCSVWFSKNLHAS